MKTFARLFCYLLLGFYLFTSLVMAPGVTLFLVALGLLVWMDE